MRSILLFMSDVAVPVSLDGPDSEAMPRECSRDASLASIEDGGALDMFGDG